MVAADFLPILIFAAALLYSTVGHAGASGYLAAMALVGIAPPVMRPAALVLNILVAAIATFRFFRAGYFSSPLFLPLAAASIPCAFLGGMTSLPGVVYRYLVAAMLLFAAWRLYAHAARVHDEPTRPPDRPVLIAAGAVLGLLSGLTGVGGGIFLSPLLIFMGWADVKHTAGVSAAFILVNSIAGLIPQVQVMSLPRAQIAVWAGAAVMGGLIGSWWGAKRAPSPTLRRMLAIVLVIAAIKFVST